MRERRPRLADPGYLAWLRAQPCACGCHQGPPCDAAHVRAASLEYDKPFTGMARKPDDRWALPLKRAHHMQQHEFGSELLWWKEHGVKDVFALCLRYYRRYGGTGGTPRKPRAVKPRKPKHLRTKIRSRPFNKQHRPLRRTPP